MSCPYSVLKIPRTHPRHVPTGQCMVMHIAQYACARCAVLGCAVNGCAAPRTPMDFQSNAHPTRLGAGCARPRLHVTTNYSN
jgi:hypothetical protein